MQVRQVDWKSVDGAFPKPRRLHLVEDSDGLIRCPITGCDHPRFSSRRGCHKQGKTKHSWYYYFDKKPKLPEDKSLLTFAQCASKGKGSNIPNWSTDNDFACSFSQWLQSSCGSAKSQKQSDISVTRAFKFIKFCCDECGEAEEDLFLFPNMIDYMLGSPQLLTSISDLLDYQNFCSPPASVLKNFAVTEVYVKIARKYLAKDMRLNWTSDLDIETLESRRSWATLSEVQPLPHFTLNNTNPSCKCVKPGDLSFSMRFIASYLFLKVKGCRPMTY